MEFSYFDLKTKTYKTLTAESYTLDVEKGKGNSEQVVGNFTSKEDLRVLGQDIRYIKMGDSGLQQKGTFFFGSLPSLLGSLIPLLLLIALIVINRKRAVENANIAKVRTKKANKVATKRLRIANKLLSENRKNEFYDEILKTLWGYISDKLNIPVSQLSKDNIEAELQKSGVGEGLIANFIEALNQCEFARYAPGDPAKAMDKVYADSIEVISNMENQMKKN